MNSMISAFALMMLLDRTSKSIKENLFFNASSEIINRTNHEFRKLTRNHIRYLLFDRNQSMVYDEKGNVLATFYSLRQQSKKPAGRL